MARLRGFPSVLAALSVGALTVTGTATFASTVTVTGQIKAENGTVGAPSYSFTNAATSGLYYSSVPIMSVGGSISQTFGGDYFQINNSGARLLFSSDLTLARLAAASMRIGAAASATPVAQTLTVGEASRPGTDSNVGGANGTIRSGLGTGTGAASSLIFQTPDLVASGSTTQTYTTRLTVATAGITATVPVLVPDGAVGAVAIGPASAPNTGLFFSSSLIQVAIAGSCFYAFGTTAGLRAASNSGYGITPGLANASAADVIWTRHSAANWRQGFAASADADGVAQTLRSPGGGTVSSGTTGRNGGAYTIQAGDGSAAKASSGANGGVGGTLTLYGGAGGAGDGAGVAGAYGGVVVCRAAGLLGFYDVTPIARAVLATGAGRTVDDVITALQNLGLVKQS